MVSRLLIGERYTANTVKIFWSFPPEDMVNRKLSMTLNDKQKVGNKKFNQGGT